MVTFTSRSWNFALWGIIAVTILIVNVVVESHTQPQPNYTCIDDGLWLGGYVDKPPHGTQVVLNLCEIPDKYRAEIHKDAPIRDNETAPSLTWLREQVNFIATQRNQDRIVYVHCRNGVSRSAMVLLAYLMDREKWSLDEAFRYIKTRRDIRPNPAFRRLLRVWEQSIHTPS